MIQPAVTLQRSQSYCVRVLICASVTVWMLYVVRPHTHTGGGVCGSYISTVRGGGGGRSEHDLSVVVMASPAAAVKCWSCEGSDATRSLNSGDVLCLSWSSCSCETKSESMNTSQNNSCAEAKAPHWHDTQNCCKWHECVIRLQWPGFFLYLFLCLFASLRSSLQ